MKDTQQSPNAPSERPIYPRKRTKLSSILQSRYAGTLGGYARQGKKIEAPDQTAWMQGYMLGMKAGMKWPNKAPGTDGTKKR